MKNVFFSSEERWASSSGSITNSPPGVSNETHRPVWQEPRASLLLSRLLVGRQAVAARPPTFAHAQTDRPCWPSHFSDPDRATAAAPTPQSLLTSSCRSPSHVL